MRFSSFMKGLVKLLALTSVISGQNQQQSTEPFARLEDKYAPREGGGCPNGALGNDVMSFTREIRQLSDPLDLTAWPNLSYDIAVKEYKKVNSMITKAEVGKGANGKKQKPKTQIITQDGSEAVATSFHVDPETGRIVDVVSENFPFEEYKKSVDHQNGYVIEGNDGRYICGTTFTLFQPQNSLPRDAKTASPEQDVSDNEMAAWYQNNGYRG